MITFLIVLAFIIFFLYVDHSGAFISLLVFVAYVIVIIAGVGFILTAILIGLNL